MFTRSPSAYEALRSVKLLQLLSVCSLKYYIDTNLEEAGDCLKRLEDEQPSDGGEQKDQTRREENKVSTLQYVFGCLRTCMC